MHRMHEEDLFKLKFYRESLFKDFILGTSISPMVRESAVPFPLYPPPPINAVSSGIAIDLGDVVHWKNFNDFIVASTDHAKSSVRVGHKPERQNKISVANKFPDQRTAPWIPQLDVLIHTRAEHKWFRWVPLYLRTHARRDQQLEISVEYKVEKFKANEPW